MDSIQITQAVLEIISQVTGYPLESLTTHAEDDLIADLGMDSYALLMAWQKIEERFNLDVGELAAQQLITIQAISEAVHNKQ